MAKGEAARKAIAEHQKALAKDGSYSCCIRPGCTFCSTAGDMCPCAENLHHGDPVCPECWGDWIAGHGRLEDVDPSKVQVIPKSKLKMMYDMKAMKFKMTELQLSFFAARLDLRRCTVTYSGAGHPSSLLMRQRAAPIERLASQNLLIGVAEYCLSDQPEHATELQPGDRLLFFTDGLTETLGVEGQGLGEAGLAAIAARTCAGNLVDMADCILGRIDRFRVGPVRDDMTLIIAELK
ncbi:MAG: serine/threonine-protein phosphatase [Gemmataceae bacterium]|nr:serine/threonine-protein phosphatase [Gemmataceae bacterium]